MPFQNSALNMRRVLAALCAAVSFGSAQAQTPGDVANGVANVAIEVLTLPKANWAVGLNGSLNQQRGGTNSHASSLLAYGLRNEDRLTYGGLVTGSRTAVSGADSGYSVGSTGAVEYRFDPSWSVLTVAQFNRAPSNFLDRQVVVAPLAVYRFDVGKDAVFGVFAGPGFANQQLTITVPGAEDRFAVMQAGAVYRLQISKLTTLTATGSRAFQRDNRANKVTAAQVKLDTRIWGGVGIQTSYVISRDDEPFAGRTGTNQGLRVSLTMLFNG